MRSLLSSLLGRFSLNGRSLRRGAARRSRGGFTLVETTLALGVAVFCLTSVCGLLSVGIQTSRVSIEQAAASNLMTAIASDLRAAPNPNPCGTAQTSTVYQISIPAAARGSAIATAGTPIYLSEDGQPTTPAAARYRLNVWMTPGVAHKSTLARLVLSWPATAATTTSLGSVETLVALDRN